MRIGVLRLQGDFEKHIEMLRLIGGVEAVAVRTPAEIDLCDGLIIPGGESTTVGKLMVRYGVDEAIRRRVAEGMTVYGTCAGHDIACQGYRRQRSTAPGPDGHDRPPQRFRPAGGQL